jgi:cytochrome b561
MSTSVPKLNRYNTVAIVLHWMIALLIIGLIVFGLLMTQEWVPNRFVIYQWHKSIGIAVLVLSVMRLFWRLTHKPPALPTTMPKWQHLASHATHGLFYGLMIVMPLLGWAMVSASELPIPTVLFGLIPLPDMPGVPEADVVASRFRLLHEIGAKLFIALIVLHIGAALKHHFKDRDDVLRRMAPWVKTKV